MSIRFRAKVSLLGILLSSMLFSPSQEFSLSAKVSNIIERYQLYLKKKKMLEDACEKTAQEISCLRECLNSNMHDLNEPLLNKLQALSRAVAEQCQEEQKLKQEDNDFGNQVSSLNNQLVDYLEKEADLSNDVIQSVALQLNKNYEAVTVSNIGNQQLSSACENRNNIIICEALLLSNLMPEAKKTSYLKEILNLESRLKREEKFIKDLSEKIAKKNTKSQKITQLGIIKIQELQAVSEKFDLQLKELEKDKEEKTSKKKQKINNLLDIITEKNREIKIIYNTFEQLVNTYNNLLVEVERMQKLLKKNPSNISKLNLTVEQFNQRISQIVKKLEDNKARE